MAGEVGFRIAGWDSPLRVNRNRGPGRFNRAGSPPTLYVCLHPLGPWAEYLRTADLRSAEDIGDLRLKMWALKLDLTDAFEVGFEEATRDPGLGLRPEDLVDDDHTACQGFADRLRADSAAPKAIVVPNAALPGTRNLVILGPVVPIPYLWAPIDPGDIPVSPITEASRPPDGLLDLVRFTGQPHAGLDAWQAGRRFEFQDLE